MLGLDQLADADLYFVYGVLLGLAFAGLIVSLCTLHSSTRFQGFISSVCSILVTMFVLFVIAILSARGLI